MRCARLRELIARAASVHAAAAAHDGPLGASQKRRLDSKRQRGVVIKLLRAPGSAMQNRESLMLSAAGYTTKEAWR
jgi:hypothetical protein